MRKIWQIQEPDPITSQELASKLDIPLLIAQLLVNRDIHDEKSARKFLYPNLSDIHSPFEMKGMTAAVDRVKQSIVNREKIHIYGDYDVDGITSVALLLSCLKHLGANVDYYIPHRIDEGYGLNREGLIDLKGKGCNLIITVDCGISSAEEVRSANDLGMDVIITDHHQPSDELPPAHAILDPKLSDCGYPFDGLAGVGVAFKLAQALMSNKDGQTDEFLLDHLDLVALGTIADVVPLMGENRIIAKSGLDLMNKSKRTGIRALCEVSSVEAGTIDSMAVSFRLAPRINAAGRIDTARNAVKLMTTDSYDEAMSIAQELDNANKERQNLERYIMERARKQLQKLDPAREKSLILAEEGWHPGVIGIAASKLQEQFYRPTILISLEGETGRGSARSIPGFDMFGALSKCSHLLERFGGHKAAAGLSITRKNIETFRKEFSQIATNTLRQEDLQPKIIIDAKALLSDISEDIVEKLSLLEPYGLGNPQPLLVIMDLSVKGLPRPVGKRYEHLQIMISDGQNSIKTIAYNMADLERKLSDRNVKLDIVGRPFINIWNNTRTVQCKVEEIIIHYGGSSEITVGSAEILDLSHFKIVDRRNIPDKKHYLQKLLIQGEKTLMYVRDDQAVRQLHKILSLNAPRTKLGLCNSSAAEEERDQIKLKLINNELGAIVSCVPFEEPLSGLKHLVFCHPTSTRNNFINSCAPAIEAPDPVYIHLIFNNNDVELLTKLLNHQYPDRKTLANIYRKIKDLYDSKNNDPVAMEEILEGLNNDEYKESIVSSSIKIFEEINLVEQHQDNGKITISISPAPQGRRDLQESRIYSSGNKIKNEWAEFSDFILKKTAEDIRKMILESI